MNDCAAPRLVISVSDTLTPEDLAKLKERLGEALKSGQLPMALPDPHCPATMRHTPPHMVETVGLQCKFLRGHDSDHAAYAGFGQGDVFW